MEPRVRRFPVPVGSVFRADIFKSRVRGIPEGVPLFYIAAKTDQRIVIIREREKRHESYIKRWFF